MALSGQLGATSLAAPPDRVRFAQAMNSVHPGLTSSQVAAILGEPHDIVTHEDCTARLSDSTRRVWCYGTEGHLTFPSLGCVYFGKDDRVTHVFAGAEVRLPPDMVDERSLRSLLASIDRVGGLDGETYSPLWVVQAVNRLRDLGKHAALSVIEEYLRVASAMSDTNPGGLLMLIRVLFEVPEDHGYMPKLLIGKMRPQLPDSEEALTIIPQFPVLLANDIPLLLVSGYTSLGTSESLEFQIEYFRKNGRLRREALRPPDNPLRIRDELTASRAWSTFSELEGSDEAMVLRQPVRMLSDVTAAKRVLSEQVESSPTHDDQWEKMADDIEQLGIRWDAHLSSYQHSPAKR